MPDALATQGQTTDAFLARYVEWREASLDVRSTQRLWSQAATADRRTAFAAHRAALDREAAAAGAYALASEAVGRPRAPTSDRGGRALRSARPSR